MSFHFDHHLLTRSSDPFPVLADLRENAPVYYSPELKGWILTRYADVKRCLRNSQYSVDRMQPFFDRLSESMSAQLHDLKTLIPLWLVFRDPPEHTRLRMLMSPGFLPTILTRFKPRIEELVDQLIDDMLLKEEVDFIEDFALPLPGYVILDLLGVPRSDLPMLKSWSDDLQTFIGGAQSITDKYVRAQRGTLQMAEYFRDAIARKRRVSDGDDLLTRLVNAKDANGQLSEDELISICILLLFGGHETTANLLGNGFLALIKNPDQFALLRGRPELAGKAVEECLRYDGPGGATVRIVVEDHDVGGHILKRGERVFAMVPAANRDPAQFHEPDRFNIVRRDTQHLTFGQGIHFCLGAPLARIEAIAALPRLVDRLQNVRLDENLPVWRDSIVQRGMHSMPIRLA
jgi:cytochrome P450